MNSIYLKTLRLASVAFAVGFVLLTVVSSTSRGALIEYAWQGSIVPNDPAEDPWGIGAPGLRFTISGFVNQGADDLLPDAPRASFELSDAVLLIDGAEAGSLGGGRIGFSESFGRDSVRSDSMKCSSTALTRSFSPVPNCPRRRSLSRAILKRRPFFRPR